MKSKLLESFPPKLKKQLQTIGLNLKVARKKRKFSIDEMALRARVSYDTISRAEKGDPSVSFGIYAQILSVLGLAQDLDLLGTPETDELGSILMEQALPERIRRITKRTRAK